MQPDINSTEKYHNTKRCYSSIYHIEDTPISYAKLKKQKLSSSNTSFKDYFSIHNEIKCPPFLVNDIKMNQIEDNLSRMKIDDEPIRNVNGSLIGKDIEMSYKLFLPLQNKSKHQNKSIDWSKIGEEAISDSNSGNFCDSRDDGLLSSASLLNYDNDIFDISRNAIVTEKIISNALESEKTLHRIFNIQLVLIPNERNGILLYTTMRGYKNRFHKQLMILYYNALSLPLNWNYLSDASIIMINEQLKKLNII